MTSEPRGNSIPELLPRNFGKLSRDELVDRLDLARGMRRDWVRSLVLEKNRIDILARILGYEVDPHHLRIAQHQVKHRGRTYLILAPRGFGKTLIATITGVVHKVIRRPHDIRILLASKTSDNAKEMLGAIKMHFEENELLRWYFGNFVGFDEWGTGSIVVRQRNKAFKEPTVETIGVDGTVVSKHFDVIIGDDLVDEKNSKTEKQRENVKRWFYKVLLPCLEPPETGFEDRGEFGIIGTRYHFADLYGHLIESEAKKTTFHFPALDKNDRSTWESKFSTEFLHERRSIMGNINFAAQMQNDVEVMKGEIFSFDNMKTCFEKDIPRDLAYYIGVDLAIKQKEEADFFSTTVGGLDHSTGIYYIVDVFEGRLRFSEQTRKILELNKEWSPVRIGVETNAYQEAQLQQLQEAETSDPVPAVALYTGTDKIARAWKLTPLFESGKVVFLERFSDLIEKFVRFPNTEKKDWFDSFDHMVRASRMRARKQRREVGLI